MGGSGDGKWTAQPRSSFCFFVYKQSSFTVCHRNICFMSQVNDFLGYFNKLSCSVRIKCSNAYYMWNCGCERLFHEFHRLTNLIIHHSSLFHIRLKPSFSANRSHRSLLFLLQDWLHGLPRLLPWLLRTRVFFLFFPSLFSFWFHAVD